MERQSEPALPEPTDWSPHDSALWYTCEIVVDLVVGLPPSITTEVLAPCRPIPPDEAFWAAGDYVRYEFRSLGDGTYLHDSGFFFATGPLGLALTAATALTRAGSNAARRRAAAQDAVPRWVPVEHGILYLSAGGFVLQSQHGLWPWRLADVQAAQMVGPRQVHLQGWSGNGPASWILESDWAELTFVTWALSHHRRHPQLLSGGWLPPGWLRRAEERHPTRLRTPALGDG